MQEEKDKVQAQKEEVLSHMNDVLENELQCVICSEYFIELSMSERRLTPPHRCTRQTATCVSHAVLAVLLASELSACTAT